MSTTTFSPSDARLRFTSDLLRAADGEPALADAFRMMLWADYCDAGAPHGVSEEGMHAWWSARESRRPRVENRDEA
ncbi:MAG: hypothetical protein R3362_05235 [Rhodothermales bacterium]|nr:hypothetical protein [Rhodothermales bacterium]